MSEICESNSVISIVVGISHFLLILDQIQVEKIIK